MNKEFDKYRLMAPGPVQMSPQVYEALVKPIIHHRTPEFTAILENVWEKLKDCFQTKQQVMLLTSTGSGAMEAAVVNLISSGDEVLCIDAGKFGERWAAMNEAFGAKVFHLKIPWGKSALPKAVDDLLLKNPKIKVIYIQACETSTGALNPIEEIAKISRKHDKLLAVDAITAIGSIELKTDEWGLDVVVAGSQKAFMLPPGLSFITLSERAWAAQKKSNCPKFYFDLTKESKANLSKENYFSSAVPHVVALHKIIDQFTGTQRLNMINGIQKRAHAFRAGATHLGLTFFPENPAPALTVINVPLAVDGNKWRQLLESKYNITVMGGQDHLKGKILRVGHLGHIERDDNLATISAIGQSLLDFGYNKFSLKEVEQAVAITAEQL